RKSQVSRNLRSWGRSLKCWLGVLPSSQRPRRKSFQLRVEFLEDRCLMAASLTASLTDGLLRIEGTEAADKITVRQISGVISVDGVAGTFAAGQVRAIAVDGLGGDDVILLNSEAGPGQQPITALTMIRG